MSAPLLFPARLAGQRADLVMGGYYVRRDTSPETGARGYFPGVGNERFLYESTRSFYRGLYRSMLAAQGKPLPKGWRPHPAHRIPPMSGGSPYADRGTSWHADDCICRRCSI